jgi:hypothetical protein
LMSPSSRAPRAQRQVQPCRSSSPPFSTTTTHVSPIWYGRRDTLGRYRSPVRSARRQVPQLRALGPQSSRPRPTRWSATPFDYMPTNTLTEAMIPAFVANVPNALRYGVLRGDRTEALRPPTGSSDVPWPWRSLRCVPKMVSEGRVSPLLHAIPGSRGSTQSERAIAAVQRPATGFRRTATDERSWYPCMADRGGRR